ncbi:zinc transporter 11 [Physcomitrium patens]|uniref:ZIP family transporter n=2 Tax=Physcomitrium patens TaxID=3218 RepID=A0A2K1IZN6_PHYPA|nr:zinc transporter 11-like [Physcomitrium patens]PNR34745.1 hypothetical protein PHYPA_022643 [Physcomitrium patens]|eukprot:XP_024403005.1 zinc transporter 11-like [Physcomitrella patens]
MMSPTCRRSGSVRARVTTGNCVERIGKIARFVTLLLIFAVWIELAAAHGGAADEATPEDGPPPNLRAKGLILVKVYCLIIVFFVTLLGGISPYFVPWNASFLVLGTQYAAGVFLTTALLHFLSDAHNIFQALTTKQYAFAEMLAIAGYLITLFGDLIIQRLILRGARSSAQLGSLDGEKDGAAKLDEKGRAEVNATLLHRASFGDTLLLILALCFHSVFEGIAIGVSVTKQDAWKAFWTITLHKVFAAIAMGIALLRMLPNRPLLSCFCYSFAFAISTPIGIAIGIIIDATTEGAVADWIYAIAMGLATGVFIYVAINHLLGKEYMPSKTSVEQPFKKFIALTLGAATMAIVMIWDA